MLNIRLICTGKLKEQFYIGAADEFYKRLGSFCKMEVIEISEQKVLENASEAEISAALKKEGAAVLSKITHRDFAAALCVEGRQMDSVEFAKMIGDCAIRGVSRLCFIIGGSNGLHDSVKDAANIKLSLSKMTFPHHFTRIMVLEQIYRAFMINGGGKYHK